MFNIDFVTALFGVLSGLTLLFSYSRLISSKVPVVKNLARSIFLLSLAFVVRSFYWDIISDEFRLVLIESLFFFDRSIFNGIVNSMFIASAVYGSAAIYEMIPHEERSAWGVLTAWWYPPLRKKRK